MFETERCILHTFGKEDISDAKELFINDDVRKYLGSIRDLNKPSCRLLERLGMALESRVIRFGAEQAIYSIEKYFVRRENEIY